MASNKSSVSKAHLRNSQNNWFFSCQPAELVTESVFSLILLSFYIYDRIKLIVFGLDLKSVPKHGQIVIRDCQTKTAAIVAA